MPMRSRAQWGYLFANKKKFARKWAKETPGPSKGKMKRLPARAKGKKR